MFQRYLHKLPILGHKELDLHKLYEEVIRRGGLEAVHSISVFASLTCNQSVLQVVEQKLWRKVSKAFQFPSTCTNSAFILRKTYEKFLLDWEKYNRLRRPGQSCSTTISSVQSCSNPNSSRAVTPNPIAHQKTGAQATAQQSSQFNRPTAQQVTPSVSQQLLYGARGSAPTKRAEPHAASQEDNMQDPATGMNELIMDARKTNFSVR